MVADVDIRAVFPLLSAYYGTCATVARQHRISHSTAVGKNSIHALHKYRRRYGNYQNYAQQPYPQSPSALVEPADDVATRLPSLVLVVVYASLHDFAYVSWQIICPASVVEPMSDIFYHLAHGINVGTRIHTSARLLFGSCKGIRHSCRRGMAICVAQSEVDNPHVAID